MGRRYENELRRKLSSLLKSKPFEERNLSGFLSDFDQYVDARQRRRWKKEKKRCVQNVESDFQARIQRDPAAQHLREVADNCIETTICYRLANSLFRGSVLVRNPKAKRKLQVATELVEKYPLEHYFAFVSAKVSIGRRLYIDHCYGLRIYGGENVRIGSNACILNEVQIGSVESNDIIEIGCNCMLCARVKIDSNVLIGNYVKIDADQYVKSGAVIGDNEILRTPKKEAASKSFCRRIVDFVVLLCLFLREYFRSFSRPNRPKDACCSESKNYEAVANPQRQMGRKFKGFKRTLPGLRALLVEGSKRQNLCFHSNSLDVAGCFVKRFQSMPGFGKNRTVYIRRRMEM